MIECDMISVEDSVSWRSLSLSHLILAPSAHFLSSTPRLNSQLQLRGKHFYFSCGQVQNIHTFPLIMNAYVPVILFMCFKGMYICVNTMWSVCVMLA